MVNGRSPLDAWHVNWTLSPLFASSSNANGWIWGKTEHENITNEQGTSSVCVEYGKLKIGTMTDKKNDKLKSDANLE